MTAKSRLHVFLRLLTLVMTISTVFQTFAMLKVERYIKTIGLSKHLSTIQFPISMVLAPGDFSR